MISLPLSAQSGFLPAFSSLPAFFAKVSPPEFFQESLTFPLLLTGRGQSWMTPVILVIVGLIAGFIVEKVLLSALRGIFSHTTLALSQEITALLRGVILWLFGLWGLYLATFSVGGLDRDIILFLRKMIVALVLIAMIRITSRLSVALVRFYLNHSRELQALPNTSIFENIIRVIVFILGFIMLLQTLGVSVVPLITALGVGGLAISLALQDTLANVFAGINMLLSRQIKVGDYVRLEAGQEGVIMDIGWRNTILRKLSNSAIIIPNSKMAANIITNHMLPFPETSTTITLNVSCDSDLEQVESITREVAKNILGRIDGGVADFEPAIRYHGFGDASVLLDVTLRVQELTDQFRIRHEFIKALHTRFRQEGIASKLLATPPGTNP